MADFGQPGGLEALDTTGLLSRLRKEAQAGNTTSGVKYVDSAFSTFRRVMVGLFAMLFIAALMGVISGGFLLIAADQQVDQHDAWKSRARAMGGLDIFFMTVFLAFSVWSCWLMFRYEKAMTFMLHHVLMNGVAVEVKTATEHLQMQNTVQLQQQQVPGASFPSALPTGTGAMPIAASAAPSALFSFA